VGNGKIMTAVAQEKAQLVNQWAAANKTIAIAITCARAIANSVQAIPWWTNRRPRSAVRGQVGFILAGAYAYLRSRSFTRRALNF
jgi:hypothetical protein